MPRPGSAGDDLAGAAAGGASRAQHAGADERKVLDDVFAGARGGSSGDGGHPEALYPAGDSRIAHRAATSVYVLQQSSYLFGLRRAPASRAMCGSHLSAARDSGW